MEEIIGLLAILYCFGLGYIMPVVAIFFHYGIIWGIVATVLPILLIFERGCIGFVLGVVWMVFSAIALVTIFGWWSAFAFVAWALSFAFTLLINS